MAALISHAQNFEDVMLWRALGRVEGGLYVDIGAQDPVVDSVSRLFHERGWRGIHVEPVAAYAERLRAARPGDVVIQAAVAATAGTLRFHDVAGTGLSTPSATLARQHARAGHAVRSLIVPAVTLDHVLDQAEGEVHWLKIDVEGGEKAALEGWKASRARPWILVIESAAPLTRQPAHKAWERLVVGKGYKFAYFDGLNRFYVSERHPELLEAFAAGPNVFDGFAIGGQATSAFGAHLNERIGALEAELERVRRETEETLLARDREHTRQWQIREGEFEKERQWHGNERVALADRLDAAQRAAQDAAGTLARREQQINDREATRIAGNSRLAQALSDRQRSLELRVDAAHQETLGVAQRLAQRESELGAQLAALQAAVAERDERLRAGEAEAQRLAGQIDRHVQETGRLEGELQRMIQARDALAAELDSMRRTLEAAHAEVRGLPAALAARERELGAQLAAKQAEVDQAALRLEARNAEFESQLSASRQQVQVSYARMAERDKENAGQLRTLREALKAAEQDKLQVEATLQGNVAAARREAREAALEHREREAALQGEAVARTREIERREATRANLEKKVAALREAEREAALALAEAMASLRHDLAGWRAGAKPAARPHWSEVLAEPPRRPGPAASLAALLAHEGRAFVECAYVTLLARPPDRTGLEYYLGRLTAGYPKLHVLGQILDSREAKLSNARLGGIEQAVGAYRRGTWPIVGPMLAAAGSERADAISIRLRAVEQALLAFERSAHARSTHAERVFGEMGEVTARLAAEFEVVRTAPPAPARIAEWPERTRALYQRLRSESAARFPEAA